MSDNKTTPMTAAEIQAQKKILKARLKVIEHQIRTDLDDLRNDLSPAKQISRFFRQFFGPDEDKATDRSHWADMAFGTGFQMAGRRAFGWRWRLLEMVWPFVSDIVKSGAEKVAPTIKKVVEDALQWVVNKTTDTTDQKTADTTTDTADQKNTENPE